jgi:hypothetical protein
MISHKDLDRLDTESARKWDAEQAEAKGLLSSIRWVLRGLLIRIIRKL